MWSLTPRGAQRLVDGDGDVRNFSTRGQTMTHTTTPAAVLSDGFLGQTIHPQDAQYDAARSIYNGSIDRRPAVIVRPRCAADVIDAVNYARDSSLSLSVRCGGHGVAGTSVVDG